MDDKKRKRSCCGGKESRQGNKASNTGFSWTGHLLSWQHSELQQMMVKGNVREL